MSISPFGLRSSSGIPMFIFCWDHLLIEENDILKLPTMILLGQPEILYTVLFIL